MGRIRQSFVLVGVCAVLSRLYHTGTPATFDRLDGPPQVASSQSTGDDALANQSRVELLHAPIPAGSAIRHERTAATLQSITEQIDWMNTLVQPAVPAPVWRLLPRFCKCWLRNYVFAMAVYFGVGLLWAYYIYQCFGQNLFPKHNVPSWRDMGEQMYVSFWALPLYSLLPSITEELCERGFTLAYAHIADVGLPTFAAYFVMYMAFVEFGVYWMHRGLHDIPAGYKHLHYIHHKYNKEHSLSPFAGLAFHPLDGILQALPYALTLVIVPMHFLTHEFLLFATALWTANIHDNLHGNVLPIMGAGWHTIHHTSYKHNYGHYFVIMDWLFGTLISPAEFEAQTAARKQAALGASGGVSDVQVH